MVDTVLGRCPDTNDLTAVVSRMITHDHSKRYQNCRDVVDDIKKHMLSSTGTVAKVGLENALLRSMELVKEYVLHCYQMEQSQVEEITTPSRWYTSHWVKDNTIEIWEMNTGECINTWC